MLKKVAEEFGGRIRIRACGLCFHHDRILLVNHSGLYGHDFWAPPGGGVEFGETVEAALKREFMEECQIDVKVGRFLFACQFIQPPLHALELFFEVESAELPKIGRDPELVDHQLISGVRFFDHRSLKNTPLNYLHGLFKKVESPLELKQLKGLINLT